jgi:protein-S-isoprenylcysteine O-methyltransferase Ste14
METIFRIILPTLIIAFALHRGYYVKSHSQPEDVTLKERQEGPASKIGGLLGLIGFVSVIVFVIDPNWLAFANLPLPLWSRWAGLVFALIGFALLDLLSKSWAQVTLGKSWSDTPRMMKGQTLIINGPYQFIRHPIYTAFILILGSTLLISSNWLIGLAWLGMTALEVISRIGFEESLMLEYFGDQYRDYMKKTGQLIPRLIQ